LRKIPFFGDYRKISILLISTFILIYFSLIKNDRPTNAAVLLVGNQPQRFFITAVPDQHFDEFIIAVKSQEKQIKEIIEKALEKREQEMSRELIKSLRDAFQDIMQELPTEYNWFNGDEGISITRPGSKPGEQSGAKLKIRIAPGPLEYIAITPNVSQLEPHERKKYIAIAWTVNDEFIPVGVNFKWSVKPSYLCSIEASNEECYITGYRTS
jgi:hypothetical protein